MSDTKFTPGPWVIERKGGDRYLIADNESLMCDMTYYPWTFDKEEDWALVSAAPELYEALELALRGAESWIHDQLDGTSMVDSALAELAPARAALAKARGEQ